MRINVSGVRAITQLLHESGNFKDEDIEKIHRVIFASDPDASSTGSGDWRRTGEIFSRKDSVNTRKPKPGSTAGADCQY